MLGKALKLILGNWQVALGVVLLLGVSHTYVYWDGRGDGKQIERAERDRIVAAAVLKAIKSEREAQAAFVGREDERQAETRDLRKAAAEAPVGEKTKAVLDALRSR